jgi:hypothetical protein
MAVKTLPLGSMNITKPGLEVEPIDTLTGYERDLPADLVPRCATSDSQSQRDCYLFILAIAYIVNRMPFNLTSRFNSDDSVIQ